MAVARQRIHLPPAAWRRALSTLVTGKMWEGDAIAQFEKAFADFIGAPEAVVVPSGRAGLCFTLEALELEKGADVICASFAYPVVPHLAHRLGHSVRFAEIEMDTLGMDPEALAATITDQTKVVIATHLYGVPCRIREIAEIAKAHGAILIEDCAHCFGASVGGTSAGSFGDFGYFSFETSKPVNTMGGGIVTVKDPELAQRMRKIARKQNPNGFKWLARRLLKTSFEATVTNPLIFNLGVYPALRLTSKKEEAAERFASGYQRDETTLQHRMGRYTNYQATLGLKQMASVAPMVERRIANAERLMDRLEGKVRFQRSNDPDVRSNYMLVTTLMPNMLEVSRRLLAVGVDSKHTYMRDCTGIGDIGGDFPNAIAAEQQVLHLPAYPELSLETIDGMAEKVAKVVAEF
ncbi:MAG: aminotransferase class I/II-fold pyridoxal phosphate-dependent enzyme [bacterium]|nr:aminotransferase class I/II-fold pyridoxal phosphate-dependent enzyme [bacterium]